MNIPKLSKDHPPTKRASIGQSSTSAQHCTWLQSNAQSSLRLLFLSKAHIAVITNIILYTVDARPPGYSENFLKAGTVAFIPSTPLAGTWHSAGAQQRLEKES